jgi:hypothetical protein
MKNQDLILDCPIEFIENSLEIALNRFEGNSNKIPKHSDLINVYFAGATLCLDVYINCKTDKDVITISYNKQTFGYFSGGYRRLLSIKALKTLDKLIKVAKINHEQISWLKL